MANMTGWPTDGADGSVSSEARWRKMARIWAPSGVISGLVPTLGSGVINVTAGAAWVDGHYAELVTPAAESSTANGLLVVRFTPADNEFELVYRDGVSTPTQTDAVWELPIAQMTAGALADRRTFVATDDTVVYVEFTANVLSTGTNPSTAITVVVAPALTFPAVRHRFEFYAPAMQPAANQDLYLGLFDASSTLGRIAHATSAATIIRAPVHVVRYMTPSAGSHTYSVRVYGSATGGAIVAGAGGGEPAYMPGYLRITR